jgi:uncharacterized membrane protein YecN with MAPEG domain
MSDKKRETDSKGIPAKGVYPDKPPVWLLYTIMTTVFTSVIGTIVYFTIVKDNQAATFKLELLAKYDLGYVYAAILILKIGQLMMGINCATARKYCKVHPPDQHVYEVKGSEGSKLGYVLMDNEGNNGRFNRAQRSVQNFNETFPQTILYIVFAGFVYSKEVFVLATVFMTARVMSALGYTNSFEGRMSGFMIANLAVTAMESLVGFIAYKLLM